MSEPTPQLPAEMPSFATTLLHTYAIKAVTALGGALAGAGVLQSDQQAQFIQCGAGLLVIAGTALYSYARQRIDRNRVATVIAKASS